MYIESSSNGHGAHVLMPPAGSAAAELARLGEGPTVDPPAVDPLSPDERLDRERFFALLGPVRKYLEHSETTNVEVNEDGKIYVERFGRGKAVAPETMDTNRRAALISYLANVEFGRAMDSLHSRLQCDMPLYGCRVQAYCPPISAWSLIIRVHARHVFPLDLYVEKGEISATHAAFLRDAIASEANIGVGGSVNSGKTTLLNALLDYKAQVHPEARCVAVQDRRELKVDRFGNKVLLMARVEQAHHESNGAVMRYTYEFSDALEDALRSNGDFLVWGEVRDGLSAIGLTMAMNTGTKGLLMTIHANSCRDMLYRLEDLLRLRGNVPVRRMIAEVLHVLVFMTRDRLTGRRRVTEVARVQGVSPADEYLIDLIPG